MKKLIVVSLCLLIVGCDLKSTRFQQQYMCDESTTSLIAEFSQQCFKNANPYSDEEPEDWIPKCHDIAQEIYCKIAVIKITKSSKHFFDDWQEVSRKPIYNLLGDTINSGEVEQ